MKYRYHLHIFRGRGMTLIEVLAVVSILALVATVSLAAIATGGSDRTFAEAVAAWRDTDARARLRALSRGPIYIAFSGETNKLVVVSQRTDQPLSYTQLPHSVSVSIEHSGGLTENIPFNTHGRSPDYTVRFLQENRQRQIDFSGLTGWSTGVAP